MDIAETRYIKVKRVYLKPHPTSINETESVSLLGSSNAIEQRASKVVDAVFSVFQITGDINKTKEDNYGDGIKNKRKISSPLYTFSQTRGCECAQNETFNARDYRETIRTMSRSRSMEFPSMNSKQLGPDFLREGRGYPIHLSSKKYGLKIPESCLVDQNTKRDNRQVSRKVSFCNQPLVYSAISRDDVEELNNLIDSSGLDVNLPDEAGITMLHRAAVDGSNHCLTLLISRGADVDVVDDDGWTPLHDAVFHGQGRCAFYLLSAGADVEAETNDFLKPIEMAENEDMILIVGRAMALNGARQNQNYDKETLV